MNKIILRDYQQECLDTIIGKTRAGVLRQVVVLATGLGKTVIFGHLPSKIKARGGKTLVLAHREELLDQARDKMLWIDPDLRIGVEQGSRSVDDTSEIDVVIASVPTLGRKGSKRITKFDPSEFKLIIIDECHHATATSYKNILEYFGAVKGGRKDIMLLGVTATPNRSDHVGLDKVFDEITFSYTLRKGIENKYLSDIRAYSVATSADLSQVKTRGGDFSGKDLADAIDTDDRNKLVVDSYLDICPGEKALVFAANVEHVKNLTDYFRSMHIPTGYVVGTTDKETRKDVLKKFSSGEIRVLVNCSVLTEGFDEPSIQAVLMARPTKSSVAYSQMIGRGTRLHESKDSLKLIDFVDNSGKNSVASLPQLMGVPTGPLKSTGVSIKRIVSKSEAILDINPEYDLSTIDDWSDESIDKIIKEIDIFAQTKLPKEVTENSKYSWGLFKDGYRIKFPANDSGQIDEVTILPDMLNQYEVKSEGYTMQDPTYLNGYSKWGKSSTIAVSKCKDMAEAFRAADEWIDENKHGMKTLVSQTAKWKKDGASEKQLNLLQKLGVVIPKCGFTKGQASVLIDKKLNKK